MLVPPMSIARMLSCPLKIQAGARCSAAEQGRFVGIVVDRHHLDLDALGLEDGIGARDRKLANVAVAKSAAHRDALGALPRPWP